MSRCTDRDIYRERLYSTYRVVREEGVHIHFRIPKNIPSRRNSIIPTYLNKPFTLYAFWVNSETKPIGVIIIGVNEYCKCITYRVGKVSFK